jgi:hypothetical protein
MTAPTEYLPFNGAIEEPELFNMVQDKRAHTWDASNYEVPNGGRASMLSQPDGMLGNSVWDEDSYAVGGNGAQAMEQSEGATYDSLGYETMIPPSFGYDSIAPPTSVYEQPVDYASTSQRFDGGSRYYDTILSTNQSAYEEPMMEEEI